GAAHGGLRPGPGWTGPSPPKGEELGAAAQQRSLGPARPSVSRPSPVRREWLGAPSSYRLVRQQQSLEPPGEGSSDSDPRVPNIELVRCTPPSLDPRHGSPPGR